MDLNWRTSSRTTGNGGNCVEVARVPIERDSDDYDHTN
jgi:hypothetical protein